MGRRRSAIWQPFCVRIDPWKVLSLRNNAGNDWTPRNVSGVNFCSLANVMTCTGLLSMSCGFGWGKQEEGATGLSHLPALSLWNTSGVVEPSSSSVLPSRRCHRKMCWGENAQLADWWTAVGIPRYLFFHCEKEKVGFMNSWSSAPVLQFVFCTFKGTVSY